MYTSSQLPPIESSEIMELIGSPFYDLNNPRKLQQIRDIVTYFQHTPNYRYKILKILSGKPGDRLDTLWTYVELNNEKARATKKLDPELFEKDIAAELAKGYLPQEKLDTARKSLAALKAERDKSELQQRKFDEGKQQLLSKLDIAAVEETLNDLSFINKELLAYE